MNCAQRRAHRKAQALPPPPPLPPTSVTSGSMLGLPCAHWKGRRQRARRATSSRHSARESTSPNMIAPRQALLCSVRATAGGATFCAHSRRRAASESAAAAEAPPPPPSPPSSAEAGRLVPAEGGSNAGARADSDEDEEEEEEEEDAGGEYRGIWILIAAGSGVAQASGGDAS